MLFERTPIDGTYLITPEPVTDSRGSFSRLWCREEFRSHGILDEPVQVSRSLNTRRGTIRGLHYQAPPFEETKLVSCISGAIWDVVVDLRPASPSFHQWQAFELTASNGRMLFIPRGVAHGFQTLTDESQVLYQISQFYEQSHERGVRWNDPAFAIPWPVAEVTISEKDRNYPDFNGA